MENHSKLQIYKGIIKYILESTNYNLNSILEFLVLEFFKQRSRISGMLDCSEHRDVTQRAS